MTNTPATVAALALGSALLTIRAKVSRTIWSTLRMSDCQIKATAQGSIDAIVGATMDTAERETLDAVEAFYAEAVPRKDQSEAVAMFTTRRTMAN